MSDLLVSRSENILDVQLNRPEKKNAMTSSMYSDMANVLNGAAKDDQTRVVLWHGAGDSFTAGNDLQDFVEHPPHAGASAQSLLIDALIRFEKPIVAAVHGAAVGGGTTMLAHCDFVYAGQSAKFRLPFVDLALVPEFGSSLLLQLRFGYIRAAELFLLGRPFDAARAAELGLVTQVVPDERLLETATQTARELTRKPPGALQACKRLLRSALRTQIEQAVKLEDEEFAARVSSAEAKASFDAFLAAHRRAGHPHA